ncbi:hypothetical protein TNCT1_33060 [Streptomyces sp. 1-11]|nr:hypothetical protein TNCT1_33060 [Streptomyces sp. 1-11]
MTDQQPDQGHDRVPQSEGQRDLHRAPETEGDRAECDRYPEIIETEYKTQGKYFPDHGETTAR